MCRFIEIIEPVNHGFGSASLPNSGFLCVTAETLLTECFSCNVTPTFEKKPIVIHVIHFDESKHKHDFARKLVGLTSILTKLTNSGFVIFRQIDEFRDFSSISLK